MEETSKEKLEIEKLKLEIKNEKKPFYKKISFYSALAPIVVSIVAVIFSLYSGIFERESKILDLRKENLKFEINLFIKQKDSLLTIVNKLKGEKDSLFKNYDSISQENRLQELKLENSKDRITEISKNIIQLSVSDFINRIKSVAQSKIEKSTNDTEEASKWINNFNNEMHIFIKECILQCSGSGKEPILKLIPDSIKGDLEKKSIIVLNSIKSEDSKDFDKESEMVLLPDYLNDVLRYHSECNVEKINSELSELTNQIESEDNEKKRGELALDFMNLNLESADCFSRMDRAINMLKTKLMGIKFNIMNQFIDLLHKKLKY
jgi:hypothetical protein